MTKILVIIPAYNEACCIASVIEKVRKYVPEAQIAVVNDGSVDETGKIAASKDVLVLNLPYNLGIGGAVQTGYKYAQENDYDIAIQVDGDGQHPAEYIQRLIEPVEKGTFDMTVGSRYITNNTPEASSTRAIGKWFLARAITFLTGQRITDSSSGFRAANRQVIEILARMYPHDYPEPETIALLLKERLRVTEIPVVMNMRTTGSSSISFFNGLYYIFKVLLATCINMFEKSVVTEDISK